MKIEQQRFTVQPMRPPSSIPSNSSFGEAVRRTSDRDRLGQTVARQVQSVLDDEAALDDALARSLSEETLDQREMLTLQATVYSYSQRVDVATRVIDRGAAAVKQLLNTQL